MIRGLLDKDGVRPRKAPEAIRAVLDRLDAESARFKGSTIRRDERYPYRVRGILVEFRQLDGSLESHVAPTRNISASGVGVVVGRFVYSNRPCRVHLVSIHNQVKCIEGRTAYCRYVADSASLYEVGIEFTQPIDVAMFHRGAQHLRVLVVDDDVSMHRLIGRLLKSLNVTLKCVEAGDEAVGWTSQQEFDLILLDLELPEGDGLKIAAQLIEAGVFQPIVAMTASSDADIRERCLAAGCIAHLAKPINHEELLALVGSLAQEPLVSSLIHEPHLTELIDEFVARLPDVCRDLCGQYVAKDFEGLQRAARELKGQAGSFGFDQITRVAAEVEAALAHPENEAEIRARFREMIRWCKAARPANCTRVK